MCHHRGNYGCFKLIAKTVFENNVIFGACYSVRNRLYSTAGLNYNKEKAAKETDYERDII